MSNSHCYLKIPNKAVTKDEYPKGILGVLCYSFIAYLHFIKKCNYAALSRMKIFAQIELNKIKTFAASANILSSCDKDAKNPPRIFSYVIAW